MMTTSRASALPRSKARVYSTEMGAMYRGEAEALLSEKAFDTLQGKIQLVFTSPPFPLSTKKRYGNLQGSEYKEWLSAFAPLLRRFLKRSGSIVLEMGNAWEKGSPTMSTLPIESLLAFKEAGGLHLCQEFVIYNPARLPAPAQWVNVERIRVKDSFTRVWWLSPTRRPKASNRRVLTEYSASMKRLLESGRYNPGERPSGYVVGTKSFLKENRGAIPPNVLTVANTRASDPYLAHCRENEMRPHPARMAREVAEFFIALLTTRGDLVLDPFAGSNITGWAAESLGRRWVSIEANPKYAGSSESRFRQIGLPFGAAED